VVVQGFPLLGSAKSAKGKSVMIAAAHATTPAAGIADVKTTNGMIALRNLEAQIDAQITEVALGNPTADTQIALIELITLRGQILGHVADYELAEENAERLVQNEPTNKAALVARARTRSTFHRFPDALEDLAVAEGLGSNDEMINSERAAIFQALGQYDEALAIRQEAATLRPSFETLGALAGLCAERGEIGAAERLYLESRDRFHGVSPFPLAFLDFQCGLMFMNNDRLEDARTWFDAAQRRVPAYAAARGHLAEVEGELDEVDTAISRLYPLAESSDDPDYAGQLARILGDAGRIDESLHWRKQAAAHYDELVERHPEAFADHAAEFWLGVGGDPTKAERLARRNFEVRKTPRAKKLLSRAISANEATGGKLL
jgi:tetratricopeptide (TPR) repeat protein